MGVAQYIIIASLAIVILGAMIGTITDSFIANGANESDTTENKGNLTGAMGVMAGIVPVILLIGVVWKLWKGSNIK